MVDLDYFKNVNDKYGHFVGDVILSETSKVMLESVRSKDMVIRYGGDEFIIMFSEISRSIVEMRLNQIRLNIQNTLLKKYWHRTDLQYWVCFWILFSRIFAAGSG